MGGVQRRATHTTPHWGWRVCPQGTVTRCHPRTRHAARTERGNPPALLERSVPGHSVLPASCGCGCGGHTAWGGGTRRVGLALTPGTGPTAVLAPPRRSPVCLLRLRRLPSLLLASRTGDPSSRPVLAEDAVAAPGQGCRPECGTFSCSLGGRGAEAGGPKAGEGLPRRAHQLPPWGGGCCCLTTRVSSSLVPTQIFCTYFTRTVFPFKVLRGRHIS